MADKSKKKKWIRYRHRVVRNIAYAIIYPYSRLKYRIKIEKYRPKIQKDKKDKKEQYLILLNHQTPFDQFFVGMSFRETVYYLATEDIFSNGWVSSLIRYLVAPIPIKKQTTDVKAILNCIRVVREGGTICIAPEGNRTYSGRTEYMSDSIVPLARKLGIPVALYRIEGGYGAEPRWSDVVRRGKMRGYVSRVIEPEEFSALSDDEFFDIIKSELYVDEAKSDVEFHHKKRAEYIERAAYVCPFCGLSTFFSKDDTVECKKCGRRITYMPTKELQGVGFDFPFRFFAEWYDYQKDYINSFDVLEYTDIPLYEEKGMISKVIPCVKKEKIATEAKITLWGNRLSVEAEERSFIFNFDDLAAITVLGKNKLNIYCDDEIYQIKSDKRFNALKYVHIYNRYKNITKGDENGKFLGL